MKFIEKFMPGRKSKIQQQPEGITLRHGTVVTPSASDNIAPRVTDIGINRVDFNWGSAVGLIERDDQGKQPENFMGEYILSDPTLPPVQRAMHIFPKTQKETNEAIIQRQGEIMSEISDRKDEPYELHRSLEDQERLRREVARRENANFTVASYLLLRHKDPRTLNAQADAYISALANQNITIERAFKEHHLVFEAVAPNLRDPKADYQAMDVETLADRLVFSRSGVISESPHAVIYGMNNKTGEVVTADPLDPANFDRIRIVVGPVGTGKTLGVEGLVLADAARGITFVFIDPKATKDLSMITEFLGGTNLEVGADIEHGMNVMEPPTYDPGNDKVNPFDSHVAQIVSFTLGVLADEGKPLGPEAEVVLTQAAYKTYEDERFGIKRDDPNTLNNGKLRPTFIDYRNTLLEYEGEQRPLALNLAHRMGLFTESSEGRFFTKPRTTFSFDKPVRIGLSEVRSDRLKKAFMEIFTHAILQKQKKDRMNGSNVDLDIITDESDRIDDETLQKFIADGRAQNIGLTLIVHRVDLIKNNPKLKTVIESAQQKWFFGHPGEGAREIGNIFRLSDDAVRLIERAGRGEGFFMDGNKKGMLHVPFSYEERIAFGTHHDERRARDERIRQNGGTYPWHLLFESYAQETNGMKLPQNIDATNNENHSLPQSTHTNGALKKDLVRS